MLAFSVLRSVPPYTSFIVHLPPDPEHLPTGQELVEEYLEPLAALPEIRPHVRLGTRVIGLSRRGCDKLRTQGRETAPFVVRVLTPAGEEEIVARAVIDASGTYESPNPLGADGTPARGESGIRDRVFYGIPDVMGAHCSRYAGRRVAVIGSGHSALNTLLNLAELATIEPGTEITWIVRRPPPARVFGGGAADALPARGALGQEARALLERGAVMLVVGRIASVSRPTTALRSWTRPAAPSPWPTSWWRSPDSARTSAHFASCGSISTRSWRPRGRSPR